MKPVSAAFIWARAVIVLGMVGVLSGCAALQTDTATVTGSVSYDEQIALSPDNTAVVVRLLDISQADAPSVEIASLRQAVSDSPITFVLPYDPTDIDPRFTYALEAKIVTADDELLFRNDQVYRVLTRDAPSDLTIVVHKISRSQNDNAPGFDDSDRADEIAAIDARLGSMRVIPGQYSARDHTVTYKAYVSPDGDPVLVDEHRDLGDYGTSDVKIYYRNGQLLRFAEDATRVSYGGANDDTPLRYTLDLDFTNGRYVRGSKTVNRVASQPDEHEISGAMSQSKVALSRIDAILAQFNTSPTSLGATKSKQFVCDDDSRFAVSFDQQGERAIVEFPGRDPLDLARVPTASGYGYRNDIYELRGKGGDAIWHRPSDAVHCAVSPATVALRLAPGDFPVVEVSDLKDQGEDIWTRHFNEMQPAIMACLVKNPGDLVSVLKASPTDHKMVGVRMINGNGGRHDCLVPTDGLGTAHIELVETTTNILPDEDIVRFTPAVGAYPDGDCFAHERLEQNGVFIGWLSTNTCESDLNKF